MSGWFKCPKCGERKVRFWDHEFDRPCDDCQDIERREREEQRLREAFKSGRIAEADLTPLGRKVCGL